MSGMKDSYRKFIRKACGSIVYELEQCKEQNRRLEERVIKQEERAGRQEERIVKLEQNIRQNNDRLNRLERAMDETRLAKVENNMRQNNERLNSLERASDETRLAKVEENMRQNNERLNSLERAGNETRLVNLEENIRKNNQRLNELEKADSKLEMNLVKLRSSVTNIAQNASSVSVTGSVATQMDSLQAKSATVQTSEMTAAVTATTAGSMGSGDTYSKIDYFDFENHFRGPVQNVKDRQKMYIPYFKDCGKVLDIGCGRGEFLELLKENDISAIGVDLYPEYAEYCRMKDLEVACGDGIDYLMQCDKLDGIMAAQLVEHLDINQIVTLCENAYDKLNDGGVLIMETPNPRALSIYVNEFYMDPSHVKPVHPETLKYLVQKAGFSDVEILYTEVSKVPKSIPELKLETGGNLQEFNAGMKEVSELLYGSRDYAIVARK